MAEWIRCNKCAVKAGPQSVCHLCECKHVFCEKCLIAMVDSCCAVCNRKTTPTIRLGSDTPANVRLYFQPLPELFRFCVGVQQFQQKQQLLVLRHLIVKYENAKKEMLKYYQMAKASKTENQRLKHVWNLHRAQSRQHFIASTPITNSSSVSSFAIATPSFTRNFPGHVLQPKKGKSFQCGPQLQGSMNNKLLLGYPSPSPINRIFNQLKLETSNRNA